MKGASYFFLAAVIITSAGCSSAPEMTTENVNINVQSGSDSPPTIQTANQIVTPETQPEKDAIAALEVKWKQGAATEMFFADERGDGDKIAFSSEDKKGQPNVFSFDDENYNVGTFYRADGKEFPIRRIK